MSQGDIDQFALDMGNAPDPGPQPETGFGENFGAGFSVFMNEDTTVGEYLQKGAYDDRDRGIDRMISAGEIPPEAYNLWADEDGDLDYNALSYTLKRSNYPVADDYDVRDSIRANLQRDREVAADIHSRANWKGMTGMVAGQMTAAQLDPVNAAMMLVPPLAAIRTGTALARVGKAAMYYGATGVAAEVPIQAKVSQWKEDIGVDYTLGDSLVAIGTAGVGSAVLGTGIEFGVQAISKGFKKLRSGINADPTKTPNQRAAELTEVDLAEQEVKMLVHASREEAAAKAQTQVDEGSLDASKQADIDAYNEAEFGRWMDEDYLDVVDPDDIVTDIKAQSAGFFPDEAANDLDISPPPSRARIPVELDDEVSAAAAASDNITNMEVEKINNPDQTHMWDDFDEGEFKEMTPEEREAEIQRLLGPDESMDDIMVETETIDADGNYITKSRADIDEDIKANEEALNEFVTCWSGGND